MDGLDIIMRQLSLLSNPQVACHIASPLLTTLSQSLGTSLQDSSYILLLLL
jgi:hypothetical protein